MKMMNAITATAMMPPITHPAIFEAAAEERQLSHLTW
jgi:hypothetical protein